MVTILYFLKSLLARLAPRPDTDEAYLAQATDICDLERRMRALDQRSRDGVPGIAFGLYTR